MLSCQCLTPSLSFFPQIKSIHPNQPKSYQFLPISSNLPASGCTWTIFRKLSPPCTLSTEHNADQVDVSSKNAWVFYEQNRCSPWLMWSSAHLENTVCHLLLWRADFPGTVYHSWQKWLRRRSGRVCNVTIKLFRQNLTKINEAKRKGKKKKKACRAFFPAHICKSAALKW